MALVGVGAHRLGIGVALHGGGTREMVSMGQRLTEQVAKHRGLQYRELRPRRRPLIGDEPEADWMRRGIRHLRFFGWDVKFIYHTYDSTKSTRGFPDVIALRGGHGLALEFKSQHGGVSPEQQAWVDEFDKVPGFVGRVVRPSDEVWLLKLLANLQRLDP